MIFPTFLATLILSFFTLAHALPTVRHAGVAAQPQLNGPGSLLGRHYVRQAPSPDAAVDAPPTAIVPAQNDDITRSEPLKRAVRFRAIQRRHADKKQTEAVIVERGAGNENLLSNQVLTPPSPTPAPSTQPQEHTASAPNTSVTLVPRPTPAAALGHKHAKVRTHAEKKPKSKKQA